MTDEEAILEFLNNISIKNYSDNTKASYQVDILEFSNFLKTEKMAPNLLRIRSSIPSNYVSYLSREDFKSSTIHRKISSLTSFYDFLVKEGIVKENYFINLEIPKVPKRIPKDIKNEEIMMMLESCDMNTKLGYRNYCLLSCLYACGIRVSELCNMQIKDIDFNERIIRIHGKGSKEREVFITKTLSDSLKHYISTYRVELLYNSKELDNRYVFLNKNGTTLSRIGVRKILEKMVLDAGEHFHISPHMIRHSFATELLNNGFDIRSVQELLGHESLSTTQIYVSVDYERMNKEYLLAHPRAKSINKKSE